MIIFLRILFIILVGIVSFFVAKYLIEANLNEKVSKYIEKKSEQYYRETQIYYNKNKKVKLTTKLNLLHKIDVLLEKASLKRGLFINPIVVIMLCVLSFLLCYIVFHSVLKIVLLSIIISIPGLFIPIFVLKQIADYNNSKIEKGMLDFLLQLKNYTQVGNDIVYAFSQLKTIEPLQSYINKFLIEINSGVKFEKAIENIKEKIAIEKLRNVFSNIEHCYLHGGDFKELIGKSYQMISKVQHEKKTRIQETKSTRIVLAILIALDILVYFSYIKNNPENYEIMTQRFLGIIILYWNFISIWILFALMDKVKKLDY